LEARTEGNGKRDVEKERQAEEGVRNKFMRCQKEDMRNILQM